MVLWLRVKFLKMDDIAVFIEKYGTGHIVAATQNGRLIDLLIDPPDLNDGSQMGSIVTVKLNEPKKGINGRFVTLPNNKKGFLKDSIDSRDKQIHSDQNDSKGVKYGCIIFCLLSAFMIGVVINIVLTGIRTVEEILPHTDKKPISIPEERGTENEVKVN